MEKEGYLHRQLDSYFYNESIIEAKSKRTGSMIGGRKPKSEGLFASTADYPFQHKLPTFFCQQNNRMKPKADLDCKVDCLFVFKVRACSA